MKLSIVIPAYNVGKYIRECVNSITAELPETSGVELLLLDDGSKDDSLQVCKELEKAFEYIRVYHHENHGVSYTRNRGIQEASGDYIMFVDADDAMCPGWFVNIQKELSGENDVIYFGANVDSDPPKTSMTDGVFGISCNENVGMIPTPWSKVYRREMLLQNNIAFDESLINGEDGLFNLQVIAAAEHYKFERQSIYQYRVYTGSSTKRYNPRFYQSNLEYLKKAVKILEQMECITPEKKNEYLAHSFCNSVYLMFFLISTIDDRSFQKQELKKFETQEMKQLYQQFAGYHDRWICRVFVYFAMHGYNGLGNFCMKMLNRVRKKVKKEMFWEKI